MLVFNVILIVNFCFKKQMTKEYYKKSTRDTCLRNYS